MPIPLMLSSQLYNFIQDKKIAITVKLCFIETRLKQDYDLRSYFIKITRGTINLLTIVVIYYFS